MSVPSQEINLKCFRRKYFIFGSRELHHNYEVERIWQLKKGDKTFCMSGRCKRCGETQLWKNMTRENLVNNWGIDHLTLNHVEDNYPNAYHGFPTGNK